MLRHPSPAPRTWLLGAVFSVTNSRVSLQRSRAHALTDVRSKGAEHTFAAPSDRPATPTESAVVEPAGPRSLGHSPAAEVGGVEALPRTHDMGWSGEFARRGGSWGGWSRGRRLRGPLTVPGGRIMSPSGAGRGGPGHRAAGAAPARIARREPGNAWPERAGVLVLEENAVRHLARGTFFLGARGIPA